MVEPAEGSPSSVLGKAVAVLRAFTVEDTVLGFAELARRTGLAKGTLHRQLGEMVTHGLLERIEGRYRLSGLVFELGMRASVPRSLLEVATPFLEELYERTYETVHLGIREGGEVVYIAKMGGHRQVDSPSRLGGRMPLHATPAGSRALRRRRARCGRMGVVRVRALLRAELDRRNLVVFIHPAEQPAAPVEGIPPYTADFLLDTTRAAYLLVRNGVMARHPNLRMILSHAGGFVPYAAHRMAVGMAGDTGRKSP